MEQLKLTQEWDKVFPKSDKVEHSKATFHNRYGITLAADVYVQECGRQTARHRRQRPVWRGEGAVFRSVRAEDGGAGLFRNCL